MRAWTRVLLSLVMVVWLVGCASAPVEEPVGPSGAIFYPPPPDQPRLQFLTSFSDVQHWVTTKSTFSDFIVGKDNQPQENVGTMHGPYGLAMYQGKLYVCDIPMRCVHIYDFANKSYSQLGTPNLFFGPVNITIDSDGTKYVCDTQKGKVFVFNANDNFVREMGDNTRCAPIDLAIKGDELYVCNVKQGKIEVWSKQTGELLRSFAGKGNEADQFRAPTNLAIGPDGNVYVVDTEQSTVKVFNPEGHLLKLIGEPGDRPGYFARPKGIAIDSKGTIFVADAQWEVIQLFNIQGDTLLYFGGVTGGPESMGLPAGVVLDSDNIDLFREYIAPGFEPEYLLLVANQFGDFKIGIYAFGTMTN